MGWSTFGLGWDGLDWVGSKCFAVLWVGSDGGSQNWQVAKTKAFYLLSIWSVTEPCPNVMRISVALFQALACTCVVHLHSATLVSNC